MKQQKRITLAVACACACMAAGSASALEVYKDKGWSLDISGSVNAFYTSVKEEGQPRSASIENGLLPGYFNITAATQQNGYDIKGVLGYWPGINSGQVDTRTNFLTFGNAKMGTIKGGRDIGLFQQNAILNDMTLIGVGGGAGLARNINTTLGGIGAGYIYTEFQPQITYTAPKMGPVTVSVGMFDSKDVAGTQTGKQENGFQGLAEVAIPVGKLWAGFISQKFNTDTARKGSASGIELGGKVDIGNLGLMAQGFDGKGIGDTILFTSAFDATGEKRDSNGYLVQATYKISDLKLGVSHGLSHTKKTTNEGGGDFNKVEGTTLGLYYSLTPSVTLVGEYNKRADKVTNLDTKAVSAGAILFF